MLFSTHDAVHYNSSKNALPRVSKLEKILDVEAPTVDTFYFKMKIIQIKNQEKTEFFVYFYSQTLNRLKW